MLKPVSLRKWAEYILPFLFSCQSQKQWLSIQLLSPIQRREKIPHQKTILAIILTSLNGLMAVSTEAVKISQFTFWMISLSNNPQWAELIEDTYCNFIAVYLQQLQMSNLSGNKASHLLERGCISQSFIIRLSPDHSAKNNLFPWVGHTVCLYSIPRNNYFC